MRMQKRKTVVEATAALNAELTKEQDAKFCETCGTRLPNHKANCRLLNRYLAKNAIRP